MAELAEELERTEAELRQATGAVEHLAAEVDELVEALARAEQNTGVANG